MRFSYFLLIFLLIVVTAFADNTTTAASNDSRNNCFQALQYSWSKFVEYLNSIHNFINCFSTFLGEGSGGTIGYGLKMWMDANQSLIVFWQGVIRFFANMCINHST